MRQKQKNTQTEAVPINNMINDYGQPDNKQYGQKQQENKQQDFKQQINPHNGRVNKKWD